jgi:hypothetical protein
MRLRLGEVSVTPNIEVGDEEPLADLLFKEI